MSSFDEWFKHATGMTPTRFKCALRAGAALNPLALWESSCSADGPGEGGDGARSSAYCAALDTAWIYN